jgi:hypothetical protein
MCRVAHQDEGGSEPADAGNRADASDRIGQRFDDHGHLVATGVDHVLAVDHDADMAAPEDEIAAAKAGAALVGAADAWASLTVLCRRVIRY